MNEAPIFIAIFISLVKLSLNAIIALKIRTGRSVQTKVTILGKILG